MELELATMKDVIAELSRRQIAVFIITEQQDPKREGCLQRHVDWNCGLTMALGMHKLAEEYLLEEVAKAETVTEEEGDG